MNQLDFQRAYWDGVATDKKFSHPIQVERLREIVPLESRILDFGCGYGRSCAELARLGYRNVVGVDISYEMIKYGLCLEPGLNLLQVDGAMLPFPDQLFTGCLLLAVLTGIPTDEGQRKIMQEIHRVLRPGGILYLSDYPLQQDSRNKERYSRFEREFANYGVFRLTDGGVMRHHDMARIRELLIDFNILTEDHMDVVTMNGHKAAVFQIIARKR